VLYFKTIVLTLPLSYWPRLPTGNCMTYINVPSVSSDLLVAERDILTRVAAGGSLGDVLRDIILMVEKPSNGEMLASILFTSEDGKHLLEGAAPSLPPAYNAAIHGIPVGQGIGSCGTAAFTASPVIVSDIANDPLWADFRDLAIGHGLRACWSMPILAADGRVLGTFANYYREPKEPTERDLEVIGMVTRTTAIAIEKHRNELARERAEEQRLLLLRELNHRVKNVFALVDSMLNMSARSARTPEEFSEAVRGRFRALSRAHELIQPGLSLTEIADPTDVPLCQVIEDILAPYVQDDGGRIVVAGPEDVQISPRAVTGIALILHELATNAAKYGALSRPEGRLLVSWCISNVLELQWSEEGGPEVNVPSGMGFGSRLTKRTVEGQFYGTIDYDWRPDGLCVVIRLPADRIR
jgi:two-component sensor histidine kinase